MDSFDKLLDVYNQVGNAIPGLLRYQTAFEEHPPLATVLEDYYSDILGFHQAALSIFTRPSMSFFFRSLFLLWINTNGDVLQDGRNYSTQHGKPSTVNLDPFYKVFRSDANF